MKSEQTWAYIHAERAAMADTWAGLSADQWARPSWCAQWSVKDAAGHILAAAEQTPANFSKEMARAGFRFAVFADRAAKRLGALSPEELVRRLRLRTSTENHPPAPVMAMLGEIVVHGQDIRRPLGLDHRPPEAALVVLANYYRKSNLLIGSKRRVAGLRLRASDNEWAAGEGPEVIGPLCSMILAMTGRRGANADLSGEGLATLANRS